MAAAVGHNVTATREETAQRYSGAKGNIHAKSLKQRLGRLLRVLVLLEDDTITDRDSLQQALSVGRRTLHRDLAMLKSAGLSFAFDRAEQRYRRTSLEFKFGHTLTKAEIESIRHWLGTVVSTLPSEGDPLASAIRKLYAIIVAEAGHFPTLSKSKS